MEKRSVCEVFNSEDRQPMTLSSEWLDDETIRVVVLKEGTPPLCGQTTVDQQLQGYPRSEVSREQAISEIQNELSGQDTRVQFFLRNLKLSWKMKAWWKGGVKLEPIEDIVIFADMSRKWLNEEANWRRSDAEKRREDEALRRNNTELVAKLTLLESSKKRMENILYAKFLMVLNEKKNKIRLLEEKLKTHAGDSATPGETRSAYDEDTENEEEEEDDPSGERKQDPSQEVPSVIGIRDNEPRPIATSGDLLERQSSFSSESEQEDIVLKFQETQDYIDSKMDEEEEEEPDLFSQ